jgi:hypothetical protein
MLLQLLSRLHYIHDRHRHDVLLRLDYQILQTLGIFFTKIRLPSAVREGK